MKRNKFNEADGACRAGPVLGKADVARNYRRDAVFKKRRGEKTRGGTSVLRQFFLMDGVRVTVCRRFTRGDVAGIV